MLTALRRAGNSRLSKLFPTMYRITGLAAYQRNSSIPTIGFNTKRVQKGHVTLKWYVEHMRVSLKASLTAAVGIWADSLDFARCGSDIVGV